MQITRDLLNYYLGGVTGQWFAHIPGPPETVDSYRFGIDQMWLHAAVWNEEEPLRLAIEYILSDPELPCADIGGPDYRYTDAEVRELLQFAHDVRWPDAAISAPKIEWVDIPIKEWRAKRVID